MSSRGLGLLFLAGALCAVGCASTRDQEVKRLQARALYEQGLGHLENQRIALGLSSVQEAVRLDPSSALYRNTLGVLFLHYLARPVDAQREFEKALEIDPAYAEAQGNLGVALAQQGRWSEAVSAYRKALSMPVYPTPELAYANLGWAYVNLKRPKEAEEAYRAAIQLQPKFAQAFYFLGVVLEQEGRRIEARDALRSARDLDPDSAFGKRAAELLKALPEQ